MIKIKPSLNLLLALLFSLFIATPLYSQPSDITTAFLLEYAKTLYEQGNVKDARHEFSKVLLIDPLNEKANEYLDIIESEVPLYELEVEPEIPQYIPPYQKGPDFQDISIELEEKVLSLTGEKERLLESLSIRNNRIKTLENEVAALKLRPVAELNKYKDELSALQSELTARDLQIAALKSNLDRLTAELEEARQYARDRDTLLEEKESALNTLEMQLDTLKARQYGEVWQSDLQGLKAQLQDAGSQLNKMRTQLEEARKMAEAKDIQMEVLEEKISKLETGSTERLGGYEERLETLEGLLQSKEDKLEDLSEKFESQRAELALAYEELTASRFGMEDKDRLIKELENKFEELQGFATGRVSQYKESAVALDTMLQARDMELAALTDMLKAEGERLQGIIAEKDMQLETRESALERLKSELQDLRGELDEASRKAQAKDGHIKELEDSVKRLEDASDVQISGDKDKILALENLLEQREEALSSLNNTFETQKKELNNLNGELQSHKSLLNDIIADKDRQLKDKEAVTQELKQELASVKEDLSESRKLIQDREGGFKALEEKIRDLESVSIGQIDEQKRNISALEDSLEVKDDELNMLRDTLKSQKMELEGAIKARDEDVRAKESALSEFRKDNRELESTLKQKEGALDEAKEQLFRLQERFDKAVKTSEDERVGRLKELEDAESAYATQLANYQETIDKLKNMLRLRDRKLRITREEADSLLAEKNLSEAQQEEEIRQLKNILRKLESSLRSEIDGYKAKLELAKRGIVVTVLTDVLFASGKARVTPEGKAVLSKISDALRDVAGESDIVVEGHTDNEPIRHSGWKSNWDLSSARALSVLHYLIEGSGVSPERFSVKGYGAFRPIADNSSEEGRKQNRRVEIILQPPRVIKIKAGETLAAGTKVKEESYSDFKF